MEYRHFRIVGRTVVPIVRPRIRIRDGSVVPTIPTSHLDNWNVTVSTSRHHTESTVVQLTLSVMGNAVRPVPTPPTASPTSLLCTTAIMPSTDHLPTRLHVNQHVSGTLVCMGSKTSSLGSRWTIPQVLDNGTVSVTFPSRRARQTQRLAQLLRAARTMPIVVLLRPPPSSRLVTSPVSMYMLTTLWVSPGRNATDTYRHRTI
mmetsp:Transcript_22139/g.52053  ORF Transcript_22139/g.52053 Transcript_22139/m.52053 type:complete len:203 (+) Transcript_22139:2266-2874(+)